MPQDTNSPLQRWRRDFFAGLAIIAPAGISIAIVYGIFTYILSKTDAVLVLLPPAWARVRLSSGAVIDFSWCWSWFALLLTVFLIGLIGRYGRNYFGRKMIQWMDRAMMRVPLLNKIYGTVKQVNESFHSNKSSFKQVVLVNFPHARSRSLAFVTGEQKDLGPEKLISVFIPTTPNPTSGFLMLMPESEITKLDISVAEGIKFIISLGAISPDYAGHAISVLPGETKPPQ